MARAIVFALLALGVVVTTITAVLLLVSFIPATLTSFIGSRFHHKA